jgi:hypothetical protein
VFTNTTAAGRRAGRGVPTGRVKGPTVCKDKGSAFQQALMQFASNPFDQTLQRMQAQGRPKMKRAFLGGTLAMGSAGLMKHVLEQYQVLRGILTPPSYTRLGAFRATFKFPGGTLGSGANAAIQWIHTIFGSFGQAQIGNYFNSPQAQALMSQPIERGNPASALANRKLAEGELQIWVKTLRVGFAQFLT